MKIIAKSSESNFLVEIHQYDLNLISGRNCGIYTSRDEYKVGQIIETEKNWKYLKGILAKNKELLDTAKNLHALANMIELVPVLSETSLDN